MFSEIWLSVRGKKTYLELMQYNKENKTVKKIDTMMIPSIKIEDIVDFIYDKQLEEYALVVDTYDMKTLLQFSQLGINVRIAKHNPSLYK